MAEPRPVARTPRTGAPYATAGARGTIGAGVSPTGDVEDEDSHRAALCTGSGSVRGLARGVCGTRREVQEPDLPRRRAREAVSARLSAQGGAVEVRGAIPVRTPGEHAPAQRATALRNADVGALSQPDLPGGGACPPEPANRAAPHVRTQSAPGVGATSPDGAAERSDEHAGRNTDRRALTQSDLPRCGASSHSAHAAAPRVRAFQAFGPPSGAHGRRAGTTLVGHGLDQPHRPAPHRRDRPPEPRERPDARTFRTRVHGLRRFSGRIAAGHGLPLRRWWTLA